jgi:hypothetical protein
MCLAVRYLIFVRGAYTVTGANCGDGESLQTAGTGNLEHTTRNLSMFDVFNWPHTVASSVAGLTRAHERLRVAGNHGADSRGVVVARIFD